MSGKDLGVFPQVGPGEAGESHPPPSVGGGGCPPDSGVGNHSCSDDLVATQAGSCVVATGKCGGARTGGTASGTIVGLAETREERMERLRKEAAAFTRSAKLARSPTMRERAGSVPDMILAGVRLSWEEDSGMADGKKRRADDEVQDTEDEDVINQAARVVSPVEKPAKKRKGHTGKKGETMSGHPPMAESIRQIMVEIEKEIRIVGAVAQERNTKKEIKQAAKKLLQLLPKVMTEEVSELITSTEDKEHPRDAEENLPTANLRNRLGKLEEEIRRLKVENMTLKKENERLKLVGSGKRSEKARKEAEELDLDIEVRTWEDFELIATKRWPGVAYKRAFQVSGSILEAGVDTDLLMLREQGDSARINEGLRKDLEDRYPEIKEDEEDMLAAVTSTSYRNREGIRTTSSRWIIRADADEEGKTLYDQLVEVRRLLQEGGRRQVATYPPGSDPQGVYTRKLLEYVFRGTQVKCLLFTRKGKAKHNKEHEAEVKRNKPRADALVIEQPGASYATLLKRVKDVVEPKSTAAKAIRTIREARSGKMVIVLDKDGQQHKEALKREIQNLTDVRVTDRSGGDRGVVGISGIDPETTAEQVAHVVSEEIGVKEEEISIGQLRDSFGGNRTVTLSLEKEQSLALIKKGGLKIGLNWCQVRERVNVIRCYRCWNYDHLARDCREQADSSGCCRRCGGTGHKAAECNQQERCLSCKAPGHTAGSGRCPEFRKALARERIKRKAKRAY